MSSPTQMQVIEARILTFPTKALSVMQPWASLLVADLKDVENRTWATGYRGRLAIHASAKADPQFARGGLTSEIAELLVDQGHDPRRAARFVALALQNRGKLLGEVELLDCLVSPRRSQSDWADPTQTHWLVRNAKKYRKQPAIKGALGLWPLHEALRKLVRP